MKQTDVFKTSPNGDDCVICLMCMDEPDCVRTRCGHHFHLGCLDRLVKASRREDDRSGCYFAPCPVCRRSLRLPTAVVASTTSGLPIEVDSAPEVGECCHLDRSYTFISMGDFDRGDMFYIRTSNDDRNTPASQVMWILDVTIPVIVHLNFRTLRHVTETGAMDWLNSGGWKQSCTMRSTCITGFPNKQTHGGQIYSKRCDPGRIELFGSNAWDSVYLVFVEAESLLPVGEAPLYGDNTVSAISLGQKGLAVSQADNIETVSSLSPVLSSRRLDGRESSNYAVFSTDELDGLDSFMLPLPLVHAVTDQDEDIDSEEAPPEILVRGPSNLSTGRRAVTAWGNSEPPEPEFLRDISAGTPSEPESPTRSIRQRLRDITRGAVPSEPSSPVWRSIRQRLRGTTTSDSPWQMQSPRSPSGAFNEVQPSSASFDLPSPRKWLSRRARQAGNAFAQAASSSAISPPSTPRLASLFPPSSARR